MSWADHDGYMQVALTAWTYFKSLGYAGDYIYFIAQAAANDGTEIFLAVEKPLLPSFSLRVGEAPYPPDEAKRRWVAIGTEASSGTGDSFVPDVLRVMINPEIATVLDATTKKMTELGLPTEPGRMPPEA